MIESARSTLHFLMSNLMLHYVTQSALLLTFIVLNLP